MEKIFSSFDFVMLLFACMRKRGVGKFNSDTIEREISDIINQNKGFREALTLDVNYYEQGSIDLREGLNRFGLYDKRMVSTNGITRVSSCMNQEFADSILIDPDYIGRSEMMFELVDRYIELQNEKDTSSINDGTPIIKRPARKAGN